MEPLPAPFEERWARWGLEGNPRRVRIGLGNVLAL
jgi:hypothetical protein